MPLFGGFEGDAADLAIAEIGEGVFGGFLVVGAAAGQECAAFFGDPFE